jgi:hypothetical protein
MTNPDVPFLGRTSRWVSRSECGSRRGSPAERLGVCGDDEARRTCVVASERQYRPWRRTMSSRCKYTPRTPKVKKIFGWGEFAQGPPKGTSIPTCCYRLGPELLSRQSFLPDCPFDQWNSFNCARQSRRVRLGWGVLNSGPISSQTTDYRGSRRELNNILIVRKMTPSQSSLGEHARTPIASRHTMASCRRGVGLALGPELVLC